MPGREVHNTSNVEELLVKLDGEFVIGVTNGTPNTEDAFAHTLGRVPKGFIVVSMDKAGIIYDGGTVNTTTEINLKGDTASIAFKIYVF